MELLEKIKSELEAFEVKKQAFVTELRKEFPQILEPLFVANPKIKNIGWTQYTPYWNDGEECTFGLNISELYINGEHEDDIDALTKGKYETITVDNIEANKAFNNTTDGMKRYVDKPLGDTGYFKNEGFDSELFNGTEQFKKALGEVPEDFYKDLFGDHVLVTINSDGDVITDEYEHD